MTVSELREVLLEANAGDETLCLKFKKTLKGNFHVPDSLVSMFYALRRETSASQVLR